MATILVAGLINYETTVKVPGFPLEYAPVHYPFYGVRSTVSGVGYNVSKALTRLGHRVRFLSMTAADGPGELVQRTLAADGIPAEHVLPLLDLTPQSVILVEPGGKRQIHVDLKAIQETAYPSERFTAALQGCDLAVLCNINFARPFLPLARQRGVRIASDVHTLASLDDAYNQDWLEAADILFLSDERLPASPEQFAADLLRRYPTQTLVIGRGAQGALLATRHPPAAVNVPAAVVRPVTNTIGAGDALFSAFVHGAVQGEAPLAALRKACLYAAYKIGEDGGAQGLLDRPAFEQLCREQATSPD